MCACIRLVLVAATVSATVTKMSLLNLAHSHSIWMFFENNFILACSVLKMLRIVPLDVEAPSPCIVGISPCC